MIRFHIFLSPQGYDLRGRRRKELDSGRDTGTVPVVSTAARALKSNYHAHKIRLTYLRVPVRTKKSSPQHDTRLQCDTPILKCSIARISPEVGCEKVYRYRYHNPMTKTKAGTAQPPLTSMIRYRSDDTVPCFAVCGGMMDGWVRVGRARNRPMNAQVKSGPSSVTAL